MGALLSYAFFKEKMKPISIIELFIIILEYDSGGEVKNLVLGFTFILLCAIWCA